MENHPIGIFDSGYGGLTVFRAIRDLLPQYDYVYLGDNARAPYGNRSFETIHQYTKECVQWFFEQGCPLVIIACNTASAKALRSIQQNDLQSYPGKRVLGVIRPTAEVIGDLSSSKTIGIMATKGTVQSESYLLEIEKFFPELKVYQEACPLLVPLIENGEHQSEGASFFLKKYLDELLAKDSNMDTILLACTHYPLLEKKIRELLPKKIRVISQGSIVAKSLGDYLERHSEIESLITNGGNLKFFTTDDVGDFEQHATQFFGEKIKAEQVVLPC